VGVPTGEIPRVTVPTVAQNSGSPTPFDAPIQPPAAATAALRALASQLGVEAERITIAEIEEVEWSDSCLGAGGPAESCLQVITPGFKVVLTLDGVAYTLHTNADGSQVRLAGQQPLQSSGQGPTETAQTQVARAVISALATYLQIDPDSIKISSIEAQEFSDSCLGFGRPDESCLQAITPGYAITLMADNKTYEIHATLDGSSARLSDGSDLMISAQSLTETMLVFRTAGQNCREVQASLTGVQVGACGGPFEDIHWPAPQRVQELEVMLQAYRSLDFSGPAGSLTLNGQGGRNPTELEQAALLAWGNQLVQELASGKPGLEKGIVLRYHRSGGIAGLCEDVIIFETGFAWNTSCRKDSPEIVGVVRLNAQQFEAVKAWQQNLESFDTEQKDQASADGMTTRLAFAGKGNDAASESDKTDMMLMASILFRTAGQV
jgi:hypothetical protein